MGIYARILDDIVQQVVEADEAFAAEHALVACPPNTRKGWRHVGGEFLEPEPVKAVPAKVSRRQARQALAEVGLFEMVEDLIEALDEPARTKARIDWLDAADFERDFPLVVALAPALGLDDAELDDLFIHAATL